MPRPFMISTTMHHQRTMQPLDRPAPLQYLPAPAPSPQLTHRHLLSQRAYNALTLRTGHESSHIPPHISADGPCRTSTTPPPRSRQMGKMRTNGLTPAPATWHLKPIHRHKHCVSTCATMPHSCTPPGSSRPRTPAASAGDASTRQSRLPVGASSLRQDRHTQPQPRPLPTPLHPSLAFFPNKLNVVGTTPPTQGPKPSSDGQDQRALHGTGNE